jgi:uncharacterized membrane protein
MISKCRSTYSHLLLTFIVSYAIPSWFSCCSGIWYMVYVSSSLSCMYYPLQVLIDQLVWCPIFSAALFCYTGVAGGLSPREIFAILKQNGPKVILSSWLVWPAAHAINFRIIPSTHRLLYVNAIQLFFNTILSVLANPILRLRL